MYGKIFICLSQQRIIAFRQIRGSLTFQSVEILEKKLKILFSEPRQKVEEMALKSVFDSFR